MLVFYIVGGSVSFSSSIRWTLWQLSYSQPLDQWSEKERFCNSSYVSSTLPSPGACFPISSPAYFQMFIYVGIQFMKKVAFKISGREMDNSTHGAKSIFTLYVRIASKDQRFKKFFLKYKKLWGSFNVLIFE